ncbi:hypothetical protein ACFVH9_34040 [Streptomyces hirsutus]|uniref:hypothetical protein n=1 Tax=Streptomyces hirsutus TaxID=35620 RepID=UPI00363CB928
MNAHGERIIGSIRRKALDHVLIRGEAHARQVLAPYQKHHTAHRPHGPPSATTRLGPTSRHCTRLR